MYSEGIRAAIEEQCIGQQPAVSSLVRGVTRVASGLTERDHEMCAYLFVGPPGCGKTHLARSLAEVLHGDEQSIVVVESGWAHPPDPWSAFVEQIAHLFVPGRGRDPETPPGSIILIENLEEAPKQVCRTLARAFQSGRISLGHHGFGRLRNCLVLMTSRICSAEILDASPRIGFAAAPEEGGEDDVVLTLCRDACEKQFGQELLGQLDDLVVFHPLDREDLTEVLRARTSRLDRSLARKGMHCVIRARARDFLLEQGAQDLRTGARGLVEVCRVQLEFPLADLLISGAIPAGGVVEVDHVEGDALEFTVGEPRPRERAGVRRVVVTS